MIIISICAHQVVHSQQHKASQSITMSISSESAAFTNNKEEEKSSDRDMAMMGNDSSDETTYTISDVESDISNTGCFAEDALDNYTIPDERLEAHSHDGNTERFAEHDQETDTIPDERFETLFHEEDTEEKTKLADELFLEHFAHLGIARNEKELTLIKKLPIVSSLTEEHTVSEERAISAGPSTCPKRKSKVVQEGGQFAKKRARCFKDDTPNQQSADGAIHIRKDADLKDPECDIQDDSEFVAALIANLKELVEGAMA